MSSARACVAALVALFGLAPVGVGAQTVPSLPQGADIDLSRLSDEELLVLLEQLERQRAARPGRVGIFGLPSAFSVPRGLGYAAVAATNRRDRRADGGFDASLAFGFGLGDADQFVGVSPLIDITSVSPHHFGESGKIGMKIGRNLRFGPVWRGAVALGLGNLVTWGDSRVLDPSWSVSVSAVRPSGPDWPVPVMLTAGYGSGVDNRGTEPGAFVGLGVGLSQSFGMSLAWYGDEAFLGGNFWAGRDKNLQISVGIGDMTNAVSGRRVLVSMSIARPFPRPR